MRFGTRVVPMTGLPATQIRMAIRTTAEGRCRGSQQRGDPPGRVERGRASRGSRLERM